MNSFHYDNGKITKAQETQEGFLRIFGTIAKVGWLQYMNSDGTTREEYVSEETLFDPEHLESIGGAVLTLGHPEVPVTPENYKQYAVGATGTKVMANVKQKAIDVVFIVNSIDAINAINSGTRELSMGYKCEVKANPDGTFNQIKRICNHNAIVSEARCKGAKLHLDSWVMGDVVVQKERAKQVKYRTIYFA
jgi:hypothetical protein